MGVIALLIVSALAIGEAFVIFALLNRLLIQAKVEPVAFIPPKPEALPEEPPRRVKFTVPFMS